MIIKSFTAIAKIMFSCTMRIVFFATFLPIASFESESPIITISEASTAISEPAPPIATPTSACDNTGASFIPSPV